MLAYFAGRHRQDERLELIAVDVAPSWVVGGVGIAYALRRDADDLPPWLSRLAFGKGEIDCTGQRIYVWSMGHAVGDDVAIPCPRPPDWSPGVSIVACARATDQATQRAGPNARAATPDFRVHPTRARLPQRCAPAAVGRKVRAALGDFNAGRHVAFSRRFDVRGHFHPYTATLRTQLIGRQAIAVFARARYEAGDGWTATALHPPARVGRVRESALDPGAPVGIYRLDFLLSARGRALQAAATKFVVDCRSGLIRRWVGPGMDVPRQPQGHVPGTVPSRDKR